MGSIAVAAALLLNAIVMLIVTFKTVKWLERLERRLGQQELATYRNHDRIQSLRKDANLNAEWSELATAHIIDIKNHLGGKKNA